MYFFLSLVMTWRRASLSKKFCFHSWSMGTVRKYRSDTKKMLPKYCAARNSSRIICTTWETGEVFIPNREIEQEFLNVVDEPGWDGLIQALDSSKRLLESTWEMDAAAVSKGIDVIHSATSSILQYNVQRQN